MPNVVYLSDMKSLEIDINNNSIVGWPEVRNEKCGKVIDILTGLNIYQAKEVLNSVRISIQEIAVIS